MRTEGFHEGELAVQRRAGVTGDAARLEGMLARGPLSAGAAAFLARCELAVITARDRGGRLWTSPLTGGPGFLAAHDDTLDVGAAPGPDDPLYNLPPGQEVGLIAVDFGIRRRFRVNGTLRRAEGGGLLIEAEQSFGNCPSYIQRRAVHTASGDPRPPLPLETPRADGTFSAGQADTVTRADTFFLGTTSPARGTDTSHRGGPAGFVRADGAELWWPDYAGNNMFNSMGNIALDPATSLLFLDFATGAALHLSGRAELEWPPAGSPGDDGGTGRRVRFRPERAVTTAPGVLTAGRVEYSPHNPALAA